MELISLVSAGISLWITDLFSESEFGDSFSACKISIRRLALRRLRALLEGQGRNAVCFTRVWKSSTMGWSQRVGESVVRLKCARVQHGKRGGDVWWPVTFMLRQVRPNTALQVAGVVKNILSLLTEEDRRGFWGSGWHSSSWSGGWLQRVFSWWKVTELYTYNMLTLLLWPTSIQIWKSLGPLF